MSHCQEPGPWDEGGSEAQDEGGSEAQDEGGSEAQVGNLLTQPLELRVLGLLGGFRVSGLGFRVYGFGFRAQGLGFRGFV